MGTLCAPWSYGIYAIRLAAMGAPTHESETVAKTPSGWAARYYEDSTGWQPVKDFLEELESVDSDQADTVYRKLELFAARGWDESVKCGLLKHVNGKNFEIKLKGGGQARVLGFAWRKAFIATAAEIKKQDELDPTTIEQAEARRKDWIERNGS